MVPYDELYDTVRGLMASEYAVAGVENLFAEGSYCQRRYDDMRQAYARLCVRLGVEDEDRDLEQMISARLCRTMYEHGRREGRPAAES